MPRYRVTVVKDKLEVPRWDLAVRGTHGTVRIDNIGFPFAYHRIVVNESNTSTIYGDGECATIARKSLLAY